LVVAQSNGYSYNIVPLGDVTPFYEHDAPWWMGKCNACERPVLVFFEGGIVYPTPQPGPVSEHIPDPMRSDLREAKLCLSVGAWNAAAVLARRALQSAAVEQGAPKGKKLWEQIKWLDENRKITSQQRDWADAARWVGNHGAHDTEPDVAGGHPVITEVSEEDARDTIALVEHLFETLYVATHAAKQQLAKRGKAKP
jgi:HEPN domain-containing protein